MTDLSDKMRALAEIGHPQATELREKAQALDDATTGFYSEPQTVEVKSFMGAYARARMLYCKLTAESLV